MYNMMLIILAMSIITFTLFLINIMISKKKMFDREKMSPFECGFDPISNYRLPFSVHFFLISLIFLIFDIEITLLIPSVLTMNYFNKFMLYSIIIFILILIIGLYIEYMEKSIDWKL